MNQFHFQQDNFHKRTPSLKQRKATYIQDDIENFKVYRFEQIIIKKNISITDFQILKNAIPINTSKRLVSSLNFSSKDNQKQLNSSCVCEECGGKVEKNRLIFQQLEQYGSQNIVTSQKFEKSPSSQQRQSNLDNSLLGSQLLQTERNLKSSIKKGPRKSIKPVLKAIQAQNFMKKIVKENNFNNRRSLQIVNQQEPLFEKVQVKLKSQFRRSTNNSPAQIRTRTEMSQYFFPLLIKPKSVLNQGDIKQFLLPVQKSQPQLLRSEKHNRTQSLQQRLQLTYLKKSSSQPRVFKISQPKFKYNNENKTHLFKE